MHNAFGDCLRCPETMLVQASSEELRSRLNHFHFGPGVHYCGQSAFNSTPKLDGTALPDLASLVTSKESTFRLPFSADDIINTLLLGRYPTNGHGGINVGWSSDAPAGLVSDFLTATNKGRQPCLSLKAI